MDRRYRWAAFLAAVLMAVAVGVVSYNAGVSHGLAIAAPSAVGGGATGVPPVPYGWYRPWGFGFFGPFVFILFWFFVLRLFFWGGGYYRRGWYSPGPHDAPPQFEEWHRRAHERMGSAGPTEAR